MKRYAFICIGGALGAILRFILKNIDIYGSYGNFPVNTLLINVTGSFLLAFILAAAEEVAGIDRDIRLGVTVGFLGAYTTFSTICGETVILFTSGHIPTGMIYITLSVILGMIAAYSGVLLAQKVVRVKGEV